MGEWEEEAEREEEGKEPDCKPRAAGSGQVGDGRPGGRTRRRTRSTLARLISLKPILISF